MKKFVIVTLAAFVLCGAAMADWAADYAAWKAQPVETRFITNRATATKVVADAPPASVDALVVDISETVYDEAAELTVRRAAKVDLTALLVRQLVSAIQAKDKTKSLAVWKAMETLADTSKRAEGIMLPEYALFLRGHYGRFLVRAEYVTQEALETELVQRSALCDTIDRYSAIERKLGWPTLPACVTPTLPDVIACVRERSDKADEIPNCLTFLAKAYVKQQLAAGEYSDALKGVIMASVNRLTALPKDSPKRQKLLDAISGVKTSLKQLQEINL